MPVESSVRVRACGPMLAPPLLDSGLQPAAGSPPRRQPLGGAGREGAGGRVRPARARVPCGREARAPPTFLPLSRVSAGAPGCVGGVAAAGPEPDTGTRGVPRAPQGRRGQDGRRVAVPFPVSGGRRHHLTSRKGQQSAGGGCRAAGWPGRRPPEPVVPVPSPRSPRGRCPARAQPRGGATGAPPWAGTAAAGRAQAPAGPGAPTLGVGAAGRACPVGPAWAAASASARPGMSLFLRVAVPLLPCCRLGAVFGVGSETPVGRGEVAPQSDTAPGSRGGAGPSGKAAWLSPALGPSVVVSGHGARTGGRLTHRPRSWVSKQVARRAPQTQQVRRAGRVTAGRLSVAASCGAEAVGAGAAGQAGLGAAVSRSRGSQPCPGGRPREPCQAPSPGAGPWAGELARAPRPTEHREQCRVCLQLAAWKLGTHRARCFQGPLAPWPRESLL